MAVMFLIGQLIKHSLTSYLKEMIIKKQLEVPTLKMDNKYIVFFKLVGFKATD